MMFLTEVLRNLGVVESRLRVSVGTGSCRSMRGVRVEWVVWLVLPRVKPLNPV